MLAAFDVGQVSSSAGKVTIVHSLGLQQTLEGLVDSVQVVVGVQVHSWLDVLDAMNAACQVLGHLARVNGVHAGLLQQV